MRLELTGRHIDITPGIRRLIDSKLARLERLLNSSAVSAQVVLSREKTGAKAEITLHARDERFLHAAGKGDNWQAAVGQAVDRLMQQAQKLKGKWQQRKRQTVKPNGEGERTRPSRREVAAATVPALMEAARQRVEPLTVAEASRQLGAKGRVLIFRNADTMELSVLYRASAGNLVLVETDA